MLELFIFGVSAVLLGAIPVRFLLTLVQTVPLLGENGRRITVKDMIISVGLEMTATALLLEAAKGMLIVWLATNFWLSWQVVAVWGILIVVAAQRLLQPRFVQQGTAVFLGGLLLLDPFMLKLFLAIWLSILILTRNHYTAHISGLLVFSVMLVLLQAPAYLYGISLVFAVISPLFELVQKKIGFVQPVNK